MEAKDTVKARSELVVSCQHRRGGDFRPSEQDLFAAQAEISFKAGIKEAVEWVSGNKFIEHPRNYFKFDEADWYAQLKEWGIKP